MAIVNKFTATLPNPSATHVDGFVFLLSTQWFIDAANAVGAVGSPIDGGAKSLANGGGDMQAYADAACTQRLPLHVVEFITGGTPSAQIWVRRASWTAGDTITIAKDDAQTVQPLPNSVYGQYSVYQDDEFNVHFDALPSDVVDSAGNKVFTSIFVNSTTGIIGGALAISGNGNTRSTTAFSSLTDARYSKWIRVDSSPADSFISDVRSPTAHILSILYWGGALQIFDGAFRANLGALTLGEWYKLDIAQNGSDVDVYINGSYSLTISSMNLNPAGAESYTIGAAYNNGSPFNFGSIDEDKLDNIGSNADHIADEYLNQSDPDNFATIGAWVDVGGEPSTFQPAWALSANQLLY